MSIPLPNCEEYVNSSLLPEGYTDHKSALTYRLPIDDGDTLGNFSFNISSSLISHYSIQAQGMIYKTVYVDRSKTYLEELDIPPVYTFFFNATSKTSSPLNFYGTKEIKLFLYFNSESDYKREDIDFNLYFKIGTYSESVKKYIKQTHYTYDINIFDYRLIPLSPFQQEVQIEASKGDVLLIRDYNCSLKDITLENDRKQIFKITKDKDSYLYPLISSKYTIRLKYSCSFLQDNGSIQILIRYNKILRYGQPGIGMNVNT